MVRSDNVGGIGGKWLIAAPPDYQFHYHHRVYALVSQVYCCPILGSVTPAK